MKPVAFHPQAEVEFTRDAEFYGERSRRLAVEFTNAVDQALALFEEADRIYVLALAPHRRRPDDYWRRRI